MLEENYSTVSKIEASLTLEQLLQLERDRAVPIFQYDFEILYSKLDMAAVLLPVSIVGLIFGGCCSNVWQFDGFNLGEC